MTDYISREAAKKVFQEKCSECEDAYMEFDGFMPDCSQCLMNGAAKSIINEIPAADVRPVVHGRWVTRPYMMGKTEYCSRCGENYGRKHNFCPNCGADMREEQT